MPPPIRAARAWRWATDRRRDKQGMTPSGPVRGALWMIGAAVSLVAMAVLIRFLTPKFSVLELIFLRNVVNIALMAPWIMGVGWSALKTTRLAEHGLRNALLYAGNVAWFLGVTMVALADVAALQFTMPLFTIVLAAVMLREHIGFHRWAATAVGFAGALVIIRPGLTDFDLGALAVLAAALLYAWAYIITKRLSSSESGNLVVFYMSVFVLAFSFVPAMFAWRTPGWADIPALIALGVTGYATHFCVTRSMAAADASFVAPFDFLRLPISAALGYFLFSEAADPWVWFGAAIIFCAAYYNTWMEKRDRVA
jgi:drug/metabolite transporter (DMT)-like permease